jgi:Prp8 binding protein
MIDFKEEDIQINDLKLNDLKLNNLHTNNTTGIIPHSFSNKQSLKLYSPTILLSGHQGEVYTGKFSNEGFLYASAGHDRDIMVWEVFEESCRNLTTLTGHGNAILEVSWGQDDTKLFSASADKTVSMWDIFESKRIKKYKGHDSFVNCLDTTKKGPELV